MSSARIRKIFPLDPQSPPNQKTPWYPLCPNDTTTACHANYLTSDGLRECPTILRLEGDQASRCHTLQQCCLHHQKLVCAYMAIAANVYFCSPTAESLPYACASAFVCQRLDHQWLHSPWAGLPMVGFPGAPAIRHPLTQQCTQNVWFCLTYALSLSCIFSCLRCDCASLNFRRRLGYSCRFEDGATHAHWHKNIIPEAGATHAHWHKNIIPEAGATHAQWPRPWAPPTAGANLSDLVDPHRGLVRPHVWAMQIHGL